MSDPHRPTAPYPATLIRRLNQIAVARFSTRMAAEGLDLTPVQFCAIDALGAHPGVDQATLAALIGYDRATLGKVVERLEKKRMIRREIRAEDRRARCLYLTRSGIALLARAKPLVARMQPDILAGLDPAEQQMLIALLAKALKAAENSPHDAPPMQYLA